MDTDLTKQIPELNVLIQDVYGRFDFGLSVHDVEAVLYRIDDVCSIRTIFLDQYEDSSAFGIANYCVFWYCSVLWTKRRLNSILRAFKVFYEFTGEIDFFERTIDTTRMKNIYGEDIHEYFREKQTDAN